MKYRMLITDDDPCLMAVYRALFKSLPGVVVDYASSAGDCVRRLGSAEYDLVLLDINLGDEDQNGLDILGRIHATSPKTDVLMMSSQDTEDVVHKCHMLGAKHFTSKNHDFPLGLRGRIDTWLRDHGQDRVSAVI